MSQSTAPSVGTLPQAIADNMLKADWLDEFSSARTAITAATALIAYQMYQCDYRFTDELPIPTAGALVANGKNHIFIDPTFWETGLQNTKERAFVLFHEILHIFLEHQGRQTDLGYHHELWSIATDYYINLVGSGTYRNEHGQIAYAEKYTKFFSRPKCALYKERFLGMSSDEIYHLLLKENNNDADAAAKANGGGSRPGDGSEGNEDGQMPLDSVSDEPLSNHEIAKNRRIVASAVTKAAKEKSIGVNEGNLVLAFKDINTAKITWQDQLDTVIQSSIKDRSTYNRVSRRTDSSSDIIMPSHTGDSIRVVYGVDSSRSMSDDDYKDCAGELKGIIDQFDQWELTLLSCDTKAHVIGDYSSEEHSDFADLDLRLIGGGGTNLQGMVDYAMEQADEGEEVNACIIVTDGHIPPLEVSPHDEVPVIVVVTESGNAHLHIDNASVIFMKDIGK